MCFILTSARELSVLVIWRGWRHCVAFGRMFMSVRDETNETEHSLSGEADI
jgi:hypothetical protein